VTVLAEGFRPLEPPPAATPWRRRAFVAIGAVLIVILAMLFDRQLAGLAQALPEPVKGLFRFITRFGKSEWYLMPSAAGAFGFWLAARASLTVAMERLYRRYAQLCLFVFVAVLSSGLLVNILKILFGRSRPKLLAEDIYGFSYWRQSWEYASFPSGHANTAIAAGLSLAFLFPRFRTPLLTLAFLVALSRIGVSAHYLSDVIAGGMVAVATTYFWKDWFTRRGMPPSPMAPGPAGGREAPSRRG
jgi:membrane-associated phospholipid phosphatase